MIAQIQFHLHLNIKQKNFCKELEQNLAYVMLLMVLKNQIVIVLITTLKNAKALALI
tara:strand:+ start:471 stop:641 length:171 start_codon:yes stop_codon:yes gene_type:complete